MIRNRESAAVFSPIRVVIADVHPIVRDGLRREIEQQADILIVGETDNGQEALRLAHQHRPDVIVLDIGLACLSGVQVARQVRRGKRPFSPTTPPHVLVFSSYQDKQYIWSMLAAGVRGYLLKNDPPERVVGGIRQIVAGQTVLNQQVQTTLLDVMPGLPHRLSKTETSILQLLARGQSDEEIARQLQVAEGTVRAHLHTIYRKIPWVRTRAEAVAWAWINRIVSE